MRVQNDGDVTNKIVVHGTGNPTGAVVRYWRGSTELTKAMRSVAGYAVTLGALKYVTLAVVVSVSPSAVLGSQKAATVTASWTGDSVRKDVVRGVVTVVSRL